MPVDWAGLAALATGVGALLAGWGALRKSRRDGAADAEAPGIDMVMAERRRGEDALARCQDELHYLIEKITAGRDDA